MISRYKFKLLALLAAGMRASSASLRTAASDSKAAGAAAKPNGQLVDVGVRIARAQQYARGVNIPNEWNVGEIDYKTNAWNNEKAKNIKWVAELGSRPRWQRGRPQRQGVHGHQQYGRLAQAAYPPDDDLGCLLCFDTKDGKFLWQHSQREDAHRPRARLAACKACAARRWCEGKRLWFVTSRCEVRCLDTKGFHDGKERWPVSE